MALASLSGLVNSYGYAAVFVAVLAESLGVPLPGETALVAAGILAATTHHLSLAWLIVVAALAANVGGNVGYVIGATGGEAVVTRYGRRLGLDERRLAIGRRLFERHGGKIVFLGRFVSILRTYAAILAGLNRMPWGRFAAWNGVGAVIWAAVFSVGSYEFGHAITRVGTVVGIVVGAVVVVGVVVVVFFSRRYATRRYEREGGSD
jgi:membrane protein DedA with SNARE-associated domain